MSFFTTSKFLCRSLRGVTRRPPHCCRLTVGFRGGGGAQAGRVPGRPAPGVAERAWAGPRATPPGPVPPRRPAPAVPPRRPGPGDGAGLPGARPRPGRGLPCNPRPQRESRCRVPRGAPGRYPPAGPAGLPGARAWPARIGAGPGHPPPGPGPPPWAGETRRPAPLSGSLRGTRCRERPAPDVPFADLPQTRQVRPSRSAPALRRSGASALRHPESPDNRMLPFPDLSEREPHLRKHRQPGSRTPRSARPPRPTHLAQATVGIGIGGQGDPTLTRTPESRAIRARPETRSTSHPRPDKPPRHGLSSSRGAFCRKPRSRVNEPFRLERQCLVVRSVPRRRVNDYDIGNRGVKRAFQNGMQRGAQQDVRSRARPPRPVARNRLRRADKPRMTTTEHPR